MEYVDVLREFCLQNNFDATAAMKPVHYLATAYKAEHSYRLERFEDWANGERLAALGVAPTLRFGNSVQALTNSIHMASRMGLKRLYIDRHPLMDFAPGQELRGIEFHNELPSVFPQPTFVGVFYYLERLTAEPGPSMLERLGCCREVLWRLLSREIREPAVKIGGEDVVVHFRSGDVFSDAVPHNVDVRRFYGQPPAAFYKLAVAHALRERPLGRVIIVFEDRNNPCVSVLENWCERERIPYVSFSGSLMSDLAVLLQARRLVFSWGSFSQAVALLAPDLQTAYWFGNNYLARGVALAAQLESYCIEDVRKEFIKQDEWLNTPDNLRTLIDYPSDALEIKTVKAQESPHFWSTTNG